MLPNRFIPVGILLSLSLSGASPKTLLSEWCSSRMFSLGCSQLISLRLLNNPEKACHRLFELNLLLLILLCFVLPEDFFLELFSIPFPLERKCFLFPLLLAQPRPLPLPLHGFWYSFHSVAGTLVSTASAVGCAAVGTGAKTGAIGWFVRGIDMGKSTGSSVAVLGLRVGRDSAIGAAVSSRMFGISVSGRRTGGVATGLVVSIVGTAVSTCALGDSDSGRLTGEFVTGLVVAIVGTAVSTCTLGDSVSGRRTGDTVGSIASNGTRVGVSVTGNSLSVSLAGDRVGGRRKLDSWDGRLEGALVSRISVGAKEGSFVDWSVGDSDSGMKEGGRDGDAPSDGFSVDICRLGIDVGDAEEAVMEGICVEGSIVDGSSLDGCTVGWTDIGLTIGAVVFVPGQLVGGVSLNSQMPSAIHSSYAEILV